MTLTSKLIASLAFGIGAALAAAGCDTTARSTRTGASDINAEPAAVEGKTKAPDAAGTGTTTSGTAGNTLPGAGTTAGGVPAEGTGSGPPSPATTGSPRR